MNSLTNMNNYYIPNTLDGINQIQSHVSDNALLVDGSNLMEADLDVGGYNIKNLQGGIAIDEAVNVAQLNTKADLTYVNTQDNLRVLKAGDTMTGALEMSNNKITGLGNATTPNDAVNKLQLDLKINKSGDTMTGPLAMSNNKITGLATGTNAQDAVNRGQLDSKLTKSGDAMTGTLSMTNNKITNLLAGTTTTDAVNYTQLIAKADTTYVDTQDNLRVLKSGDTMTGALRVSATAPQITFDVAGGLTGSYLQVGAGGSVTLNGATNLNLNAGLTNTMNFNINGSTKMTVASTVITATTALNMSSQRITGLGNPVATTDAVNVFYVTNTLAPYALDASVLHRTLDETKTAGILTFNVSPVVPLATLGTQAANLNNITTAISSKADTTYVDTQDNLRVLKAGDTMTGALTMSGSNQLILNKSADDTTTTGGHLNHWNNDTYIASRGLTSSNGIKFNTAIATAGATEKMRLTCDGKLGIGTATPTTLLEVVGTAKIHGTLNMITNKIINLGLGTDVNDAVNKGQMDTEINAVITASLASKERTRPQAQYCKAWRKVGGVDTAINVMGIGWSVGIHQDSVSGSGSWGLEHTPVNDGVYLRVDVPLYKGDVVNGFFFGCKAPDDNGSVVKIFVYDFGDNKVATTEASTCANQYVVYCPFTTAWTVPSTQTYRVCIVWQSGGVNHILSTVSGWISFFNNMASAYNNTYINQTNKTPPNFYDLVDVPLTRNSIVYAYRTI